MGKHNNAAVDNLFASDAEWRAWCQEIDTALKASGFLVAAADTGQIDLTTAVRGAINTYSGYKIYRANDVLQATKPMFLKVEYGVAGAITRPLLRFQMSTATNGAGALSGQNSTLFSPISAAADGSGASRIMGGGDDTCAWISQWDGLAVPTQNFFFVFGRSIKRLDGSATGDFMFYGYSSSSANSIASAQLCTFSAVWSSLTFQSHITRPDDPEVNTGGDVNVVYLFDAVMYRAAEILTFPFVIGKTTELPYTDPDGGQFTINVWGGVRTFTPTPPFAGLGTTNVGRACFPWEA
jgi:hypothetical protein